METADTYWSKYYQKKRSIILKKRKDRYVHDEAYRLAISNRARLTRKLKILSDPKLNPPLRIGNRVERTYSLKQLGTMLPRGYSSLQRLSEFGIIPPALLHTDRCAWYGESQYLLMKHVMSRVYSVNIMEDVLHKLWKERYDEHKTEAELKRWENFDNSGKGRE